MGFVNKDGYERKREWAAKRQAEQKENCTTLTEEQHDVIAWLCGVRHFIHTNMDRYYFSESSEHDTIIDYFYSDNNGINAKLSKVGLPPIKWEIDIMDTISDFDFYEGLTEYKESDDAYEAAYKQISKLHEQIEDYLREIDRQHKTQYAPSGATRIY